MLKAADKDTVSLGGGETVDLYLRNKSGQFTVALRAVENDLAGVWVGGKGQKGLLILLNGTDKNTVSLGGKTGDLYLRNKSGQFTVALRAVVSSQSRPPLCAPHPSNGAPR